MSNSTWHNWHNTTNVGGAIQQELTPNNGTAQQGKNIQDETFQPGLNALLGIVRNAMASNRDDVRVRAYGSKWSLNNAAYTSDIMVKTWDLNYAKIGLDQDMVAPAYQGNADKLCFVQTGVFIHYLNIALYNKGLALKTTGASDGQRLVGAIAAGTHGSAMHVGAMQDFVKGIHLVIPDGDAGSKHIFLQRRTDQAVNANFATFLDHTELIDDDALFNAALISFGCFGLIHGLLIETEPLFMLKHQVVKFNPNLPWYRDKLQRVLGNPTRDNIRALAKPHGPHRSPDLFNWLDAGNDYPYFFSVTQNPYTNIANPRTFFIEVMEKMPFNGTPPPLNNSYLHEQEKHEAIHSGFEHELKKCKGIELGKGALSKIGNF